jgi:hypothetical protein
MLRPSIAPLTEHETVLDISQWMYLTSGFSATNNSRRFADSGVQNCKQWTEKERTLCGEESRPQRIAEHLPPSTATSLKLTYVNFTEFYMAFLRTNALHLKVNK